MKAATLAGAPGAGKTSILLALARLLLSDRKAVAAVKFDALATADDRLLAERLGIPALKGLGGYVCPDHYYVSNLEQAWAFGVEAGADFLFIETAGLCCRCAPHLEGIPALGVVSNLSGLDAPAKVGPAILDADILIITGSDLVSQAEKEVFAHNLSLANPRASVVHVHGPTGRGTLALKRLAAEWPEIPPEAGLTGRALRCSLPAAVCSYCMGETRVGRAFQSGNVKRLAGEAR